jgi:uncharacterized protein with HEPN domain
MDCAAFHEAATTIAAVEHQLHLITEAAVRLGADAESRCAGPSWRDIRGMGNWLPKRREWNWVLAVWKMVRTDLPPLKAAVVRALVEPPQG